MVADKSVVDDGDPHFDESKYRPAHGSVPSEIDVADDEHPLKQVLGDKSHRKLEADEGTLGERFAFRYKRSRTFVREWLANSETACIRRARYELVQNDADTYTTEWFADHTIPEILDEARTVAGYHPVIEVHTAPPGSNRDRFVLEDNGIGISVSEFVVMKTMGLSTSHDEGSQLGNFGQGVMSVFNAVGEYGEFEGTTWSCLDDANYSFRFRIDGTNDLPGTRDDYGTTLEISSFSDEARDIDLEDAMDEYAEGMFVPTIHHIYGDDGAEVGKEEYTYQPLEELIPNDAPRVTYEDSDVEAVASPVIGLSNSNVQEPKTFLVSMPIERGSANSYSSPWKFHVRLKREDGAIYECTHENEDHCGLTPVEPKRLEAELIKDRDALHPDQLVPGDLVGYELDDAYAVPTGVDDAIVAGRDDLVAVDRSEEWGEGGSLGEQYPNPIEGYRAVVVAGSRSHEGREVVSEEEWESIESDVTEKFVSTRDVVMANPQHLGRAGGYDVVMPTPVDDRDRFKEHNGVFFNRVAEHLHTEFNRRAQELLSRFEEHEFDAWATLDQKERSLFVRATEMKLRASSSAVGGSELANYAESEFDVILDEETAEKIAGLFDDIELAHRSSRRPNRKAGRTDTMVKDVLLKAGDSGDVYMGATISKDRAKLAWALGDDNQVVCVDGANQYPIYEELFGWTRLTELSLYDVDQYDIPSKLADDIRREQSESTGGGWSGELDAPTREIKIRAQAKREYSSTTAKSVIESFQSGETIHSPGGSAKYLLVFREPEVSGVNAGKDDCYGPIARAVVPNYVADYFEEEGTDEIYVIDGFDTDDALESITKKMNEVELEYISLEPYVEHTDDGIEVDTSNKQVDTHREKIGSMGPETLTVILPNKLDRVLSEEGKELSFIDRPDAIGIICESLVTDGHIEEEHTRLVLTDSSTIDETAFAWYRDHPLFADESETPDLIKNGDASVVVPESEKWHTRGEVYMDIILPESIFDRNAPEWRLTAKKNSWDIKRQRSDGETIVKLLHRLAEVTPDDEPVFPSQL